MGKKNIVKMEIPDEVMVQLSNISMNQVLKNIEQASASELDKEVKIDWNDLKKEALNFLSTVVSLDKDYVSYTQAQLKQVVQNPQIAPYVNELNATKEKYYVQSLYMLAAKFEDYLSRFREEDKERSMLYVFTSEDGKTVETYEMSFRELILNADKHGRWADISKKRLTNQRIHLEDENFGLFDKEHIKEAQSAYEGTLQRYMRYFDVHPKSQKQNALILWKENNEWAMGNLINTGDLKEAYTAYLFSDHQNNLLCAIDEGKPPYYSHEFIGTFYKNYITKVTSLEAILEEDVLTTNKQYGVKGRKASLPSFQQYVDAANLIIAQNIVITKEELEKKLDEKFKRGDETKGARNIQMSLEDAIKNEGGYLTVKELQQLQKILS